MSDGRIFELERVIDGLQSALEKTIEHNLQLIQAVKELLGVISLTAVNCSSAFSCGPQVAGKVVENARKVIEKEVDL